MKKINENKKLSVSEQMKAGEILGAKVAKIMNKAKQNADKVLADSGHCTKIDVVEGGIFVRILKMESREV